MTPVRRVEHFWIRRQQPTALWLEGLCLLILFLLLIGYALGLFARNDIETSVRSETRAALDSQGYDWVHLSTAGQDVLLSGRLPAAQSGDAVLAAARAVACPTWLGRVACPINVIGTFSSEPVPVSAALPADEPRVTEAAACEKSFNDIVAQSHVVFASGSAEIRRSDSVLDALAKAAGNCSELILVEGHTDSMGSPSLNVALSAARAKAVAAALVRRGVPQARLQAQGFGASMPIADNSTADGREKNRRIDFRVVQKDLN